MLNSNSLIKDYTNTYGSIMQFNKNKNSYIHGWYPFVEGYSKEFIINIVDEFENNFSRKPFHCLEPFAGSGTTPLELQKLGIQCSSFEVSPFMYNLSITKLETMYTTKMFNHYYNQISHYLDNYITDIMSILSPPNARTIVERVGLEKWNFNKEVMQGLLDIKYSINQINSKRYQSLFRIALASILLEVSNVYRNGKCISYKSGWRNNINYSRTYVHNIFLRKLREVFLPDICTLNRYKKTEGKLFSNKKYCYLGDVRKNLPKKIDKNTIDLIITSPPYLNSRDYTDTYMLELRMLDFAPDNESLRTLRKNTLRSHVQVKWENVQTLNINSLKNTINNISKHKDEFWNDSLLNMINGYFVDMDTIFKQFNTALIDNGMIYFNVANSAYYGEEIKTDEIVSEIAEKNGFEIAEIRLARKIKPSSQQQKNIEYLRESVIVAKKKKRV